MKRMNKVLTVTLAVVMLVGILPMAQIVKLDISGWFAKASAADVVESGTCGDNMTWELDSDGRLTISGSGAMTYYNSYNDVPWYSHKDDIVSVVIEEGITNLTPCAIYNCYRLKDISLPDSLETIGAAFTSANSGIANCSSLETIYLPKGIIRVQGLDFSGCNALAEINVSEENPFYKSVNGVVFDKNLTTLVKCPASYSDSVYNIPDSVIAIEDDAFRGCKKIYKVSMSNNVTSIGSSAFYDSNLGDINISDSVTEIQLSTFGMCMSLGDIVVPRAVEKIGWSAFYCSLRSITILNPNCKIYDTNGTILNGKIYGYNNSTAEEYATKYNHAFVSLGDYNVGAEDELYYGYNRFSYGEDFGITLGETEESVIKYISEEYDISDLTIASSDSSIVKVEDIIPGVGSKTEIDLDENMHVATVKLKGVSEGTATISVTDPNNLECSADVTVYADVHFIKDYDKYADAFRFLNQVEPISFAYYSTMYGPIGGAWVSFVDGDDGTGGQCYGMASANGLFLEDRTRIGKVLTHHGDTWNSETNSFDYISEYAQTINGMWNSEESILDDDSYVSNYEILISDLIKFGYIRQFTSDIEKEKDQTRNKYQDIVNASKRFVDGVSSPIVIGIRGGIKDEGHALLPVGYLENEEQTIIYVHDSNYPVDYKELVFDKNGTTITGWSYSPLNWGSNRVNGRIYYSSPIGKLNSFCTRKAQIHDRVTQFFSIDSLNAEVTINEHKFLLANSDSYEELIPIIKESATSEENAVYSFWVDAPSITNIILDDGKENAMVSFGNNDVGYILGIPGNSSVDVNLSQEIITITCEEGSQISATYLFSPNGVDCEKIKISGTSSSTKASIVSTESGLNITGLHSGTITISDLEDNAVATKSFSAENSSIEVSFDRTGESDKLEIVSVGEQQDSDGGENNLTACKWCGEVHTGFWGKFVGFFHKIAYFFAHLFGKR